MRHCRDSCPILQYIPFKDVHHIDREPCPILGMKKTRKQSEWCFVKNGEKLYPACEEKGSKTGPRGVMIL